jgi:signal transduction histidine kinase
MDKKTLGVQESVNKLFLKIFIFDFIILIIFIILSLLYTSYFKQRLASQLADSFRTPLINGDNRTVIKDMLKPVFKDFSAIALETKNSNNNFVIPENFNNLNWIYGVSTVTFFFDDEKNFEYGKLNFYYNRWVYISFALIVWIVFLVVSVIVAHNEKRRLMKEYKLLMDLQISKSISDISLQVAHDIRSPLASLKAGLTDLTIPEENGELINGAIKRISGIAHDLLDKYRKEETDLEGSINKKTNYVDEKIVFNAPSVSEKEDYCNITEVINNIIAEKKVLSDIEFIFNNPDKDISINISGKEFSRIISNIVNNSIEAIENRKGKIEINISKEYEKAILSIKDNGKGIPEEIIKDLGKKGFSYNKEKGNGLGIWHAKETIEKAGGSIEIKSELGRGTEIVITFPLIKIKDTHNPDTILIDDDPLVRKNWEIRAKKKNIRIKIFKSAEDFLKEADEHSKDALIYIDSELSNDIKGEEVAKLLYEKGFKNIYIETGYSKDKFKDNKYIKDIISKEPPF